MKTKQNSNRCLQTLDYILVLRNFLSKRKKNLSESLSDIKKKDKIEETYI
jgi:hypothetical protein